MQLFFKTKEIELSEHTKDHVEKKLRLLENALADIQDVHVRCEKNQRHLKGDVVHVSVDVRSAQATFHSESDGSNVEGCVEIIMDQLKSQMRKHAGKERAKMRKAGRARRVMKSLLFWK